MQTNHLTTRAVAKRYNVCRRTISRWQANRDLGFPAPLLINKRRYWREADLQAWEIRRRADTAGQI